MRPVNPAHLIVTLPVLAAEEGLPVKVVVAVMFEQGAVGVWTPDCNYLTQAGSKIFPPAELGASHRLGASIPMPRIGAPRLNLLST